MNDYKKDSLIITKGIYYPRVLLDVKKSTEFLRPVFEGVMNSFEAIRDKSENIDAGKVTIRIFSKSNLVEPEFEKIQIEDNGVGFDDENFERFLTFKDDRKGSGNKGSGRIQFIQFFDSCEYVSTYQEGTTLKERKFELSKSNITQNGNALVFLQRNDRFGKKSA